MGSMGVRGLRRQHELSDSMFVLSMAIMCHAFYIPDSVSGYL